MALIRFDPFHEMRSLMRTPFGRFPLGWDVEEDYGSTMAVDMYETDEAVVIQTALPGIDPDQVDITITGDTVTIKGQTRKEEEEKKKDYFRKEMYQGTYSRSVSLPTAVQSDQAEAEFKDGLLTLTIPKAEEAKPKQIKVKAAKN